MDFNKYKWEILLKGHTFNPLDYEFLDQRTQKKKYAKIHYIYHNDDLVDVQTFDVFKSIKLLNLTLKII